MTTPKRDQVRRPLVGADDRTVPVTVQTRTSLNPSRAFDIIAPIDLSLVFTGWGPFPGVSDGLCKWSGLAKDDDDCYDF